MRECGAGLLSFSDVLYMQARGPSSLLSATHTILQGNIEFEDNPEEKAAARDANRERKRRQRHA